MCFQAALVLSLLLPLLFYYYPKRNLAIPSVSILHYLPGGLLHPLLRDSGLFLRTLHKLANKYGPIFYTWLGTERVLVTSVPADIVQVLQSKTFNRPESTVHAFHTMAPGALVASPQKVHAIKRKWLREHCFNEDMLNRVHASLAPAVSPLCKALYEAAEKHKGGDAAPVDISHLLCCAVFRIMVNVTFGQRLDKQELEEFVRTASSYFNLLTFEIVGYPVVQMLRGFGVGREFWECKKKMDGYYREFVRKRREGGERKAEGMGVDFLDVLLGCEEFSEEEICSILIEFTLGGTHTTSQLLAWCIYETCGREDIVCKVRKELGRVLGKDKGLDELVTREELGKLEYIQQVYKEGSRMHHMGGPIARRTTTDMVLKGSGMKVERGTHVMVFLHRAQMDAGVWSEAERFKPERWGDGAGRAEGDCVPAGSFLPFSLGYRGCLGRRLAEIEVPLLLAELFRRFEFELGCERGEIVSNSSFVERPKYVGGRWGAQIEGVPVFVVSIGNSQ